jgi:hypothetical protein
MGIRGVFLAGAAATLFVLTGCIGQKFYRTTLEATCDFPATGSEPDRSACIVQHFLLPNARSRDPVREQYTLAFQEFDRSGRPLPAQNAAIDRLLSATGDKYVVVYVHGWRHNAAPGDQDIQRFRKMLAFSRAFMNRRPDDADKELIGIYVGWTGARIREPNVGNGLSSAIVAPSFPLVKAEADRITPGIYARLEEIDRLVRGVNPGGNKLLFYGHSTGANILATGIESSAIHAVESHEPGQRMGPILGDLTVLINPASEAAKWVSIQEAMRRRANVPGDEADFYKAPLWRTLYPIDQPPLYLSFTSTRNWSAQELRERDARTLQFDSATEMWFRLSQTVFGKTSSKLAGRDRARYAARHAIGHVLPTNIPGVSHPLGRFGATHELTVLAGSNSPSDYSSINPDNTQCSLSDGWLVKVRAEYEMADGSGNWDTGYHPDTPSRPTTDFLVQVPRTPDRSRIQLQLRRGITIDAGRGTDQYRAVVPLHSPFWNVRVFDEVIEEHGGYNSHAFFCLLTQLVLDDPVARTR